MWMNNIPNIEIDQSSQSIYKNIARSKLVVYTYNSTGYLELMAANLPVLLYWSNTIIQLTQRQKVFLKN